MAHVWFQEIFSCQENKSNWFEAPAVHLHSPEGAV